MITPEDLDQLKLVFDETYYANENETDQYVNRVLVQASQGWGVRATDGVILSLLRQLSQSLPAAAAAEKNARLLKGAQLETGRLKKKIRELENQLDALRHDNETS